LDPDALGAAVGHPEKDELGQNPLDDIADVVALLALARREAELLQRVGEEAAHVLLAADHAGARPHSRVAERVWSDDLACGRLVLHPHALQSKRGENYPDTGSRRRYSRHAAPTYLCLALTATIKINCEIYFNRMRSVQVSGRRGAAFGP